MISISFGDTAIGAFFPDAFTSEITSHATTIEGLQTVLTIGLFDVMGFTFTTMHAFALALVVGTILILNSKPGPSSQGVSYGIFTIVFWGGITSTWGVLKGFDVPGIDFIYTMFVLIATLVFIMALIQMSTGGQKSHV